MKFNFGEFRKLLHENNISVIYSGPIWQGGIDGLAEMLLKRLEFEDMPLNASQSVFSIFVEQMSNMLMYSAEKVVHHENNQMFEVSMGTFILAIQNMNYYIESVNVVTDKAAVIIKNRIDYLNTLDKKELRKFQKKQLLEGNDNPDSKGAGIGLVEIARRASGLLEYEFMPVGSGLQSFTLYITVNRQEGGEK